MKGILNYYSFAFALYILLALMRIQAKTIIIKNDESYIKMKDIINNNQNDNELILEFVDNYYDMRKYKSFEIYNTEISIQSFITFKGNSNETIFDYKSNYYGNIHMSYEGKKNMLVKFENITFKNFNPISQIHVGFINVISHVNNFQLQFYNCTFIDNMVNNVVLLLEPEKVNIIEPQVIFDNCHF